MICAQCGNQMTDQDTFCSRCGKALSASTSAAADSAPTQPDTLPGAQRPQRRTWILVAAVVVVGLLIGAFALSRGDSANIASCKQAIKNEGMPSSVEWGDITEREIAWEKGRYNGRTIVDNDGNPYPKVDYLVEGSFTVKTPKGDMTQIDFACGRESTEKEWRIDLKIAQ